MITTTNFQKHEFIGSEIQIVGALNNSLNGMNGTIVDETRNTFVIQTEKGEKKVLKKQASFQMNVQNQDIIIDGNVLVGKAEDRLKK